MAILMVGIRRLVRHPDRKERYNGCDEVETGMSSLRENTQASRRDSNNDLEPSDRNGGKNRIPGNPALLFAHGFGRVRKGGVRHQSIIAVGHHTTKAQFTLW